MRKRIRPAVDLALAPRHGVSRDGQALSYNRAPAADLAPWIARLYATAVDAPADHKLECGLLNDTSTFRIQLKGKWTATTADGRKKHDRAALFFGPHTRRMPISVAGGFISVGIALRPGTGHALLKAKTAEYLDKAVPCDDLGLAGEPAISILEQSNEPEEWLQTLEHLIREYVDRTGATLPDPITTRFETVAFTDPTMSIASFAKDCGIEQRRLERIIRRDFGLPPKQVLRRARALDMASWLRGVADQAEGEELTLRYYDQSHLIREFSDLFGMSPSQFVSRPQPIMTLALESRQARRLEAIERLKPGAARPWQ